MKKLAKIFRLRRYERDANGLPKDAGVSGIIELVIVLVILGILTAILLPTFLGTTQNAKVTSAESNLSTAVTNTQTFYANSGQTFGVSRVAVVSSIQASEPGLVVSTSASADGNVAVLLVSSSEVVLGTYSAGALGGTGGCIYASINNSGSAATYPTGTTYAAASGGCTSSSIPTSGWLPAMPSASTTGGGGSTLTAQSTEAAILAAVTAAPIWMGTQSGITANPSDITAAIASNPTLNAAYQSSGIITGDGHFGLPQIGTTSYAFGVYSSSLNECVFTAIGWAGPGTSEVIGYNTTSGSSCNMSNFPGAGGISNPLA